MKINVIKYHIIVFMVALALSSCKKVISLDLGNVSGELVIEGNITNIPGPQYVTLSRNVPFTSPNVYPPVTGATVTMADGRGNQYQLTEGPAGTYSINP